MSGKPNNMFTIIIVAAISAAVAVGAYVAMQPKKPATLGEKLDAAAQELSKGVDGAAKALDQK